MTAPENTAMQPLPDGQPLATVPDDLLGLTAQDAGLGTDPADQLMPLITTVQSNTPIAEKRSAEYRVGAEPGSFWFRNDLIEFRDGVAGFVAIPIEMQTVWIEWGPTRGSGRHGRHPERPNDAELRTSLEDSAKSQWVRRSNSNVVVETREFFIMTPDAKPYLMPFTGAGHTTAKRWQTYFQQFRHPRTGGVMPAYSRKYLLTTVPQADKKGHHWFGVRFQDRGWVSRTEYDAARALHAVVVRGAYRLETSPDETAIEPARLTQDGPGVTA